jgi:hypothetical protein
VTDPHNVGAALRSAAVFGARAVIAPRRHAAPETGALAKTASGALETQPYLRVPNLARAMETLAGLGFEILGLDGDAAETLDEVRDGLRRSPRRAGARRRGAGAAAGHPRRLHANHRDSRFDRISFPERLQRLRDRALRYTHGAQTRLTGKHGFQSRPTAAFSPARMCDSAQFGPIGGHSCARLGCRLRV